jgi:phospholipase C
LEEHGISWKVYQNELSLPTGLTSEAESWLANYGDNPLEYLTQYNVRYIAKYRVHLVSTQKRLYKELDQLMGLPTSSFVQLKIEMTRRALEKAQVEARKWTEENFSKLSPQEQNIHRKAFVTNTGDPTYRQLTDLTYDDNGKERTLRVPKGDLFHQFREDIDKGTLPTVSWIVAPENFSDHPSSPWYGAWYLSETLDILTQKPEVWKKTIFILCYDENDGYFDHVPPFVAPDPSRPETGKASADIDTSLEHVRMEQEEERQRQFPNSSGRAGPIGLGYRVPLVIASPWSRGGYVCSQVFDHTSILQLLEKILSHKTKLAVQETNISAWRRTVCGDLTAAFRPYNGEKMALPTPVERDAFMGAVHRAQFKEVPAGFKKLKAEEIAQARTDAKKLPSFPKQEAGMRPSCGLPYELSAAAALNADRKTLTLRLAAGKELFGERSAGGAFHVYVLNATQGSKENPTRAYAVSAGDSLSDSWSLEDFRERKYQVCVHGPNGFFREFRGSADDPSLEIKLEAARVNGKPTRDLMLRLSNRSPEHAYIVSVDDLGYGAPSSKIDLAKAGSKEAGAEITVELKSSFGWHDLRIRVEGAAEFSQRFAGRIETAQESFSDPLMA